MSKQTAAENVTGPNLAAGINLPPASSPEFHLLRTLRSYRGLQLSREEAAALGSFEAARQRRMESDGVPTGVSATDETPSDDQLAKILGSERQAEYVRLQDPDYTRLHSCLEDHAAPSDQIVRVYEALKNAGTLGDLQASAAELETQFGAEIGQEWNEVMEREQEMRPVVGKGE